jgi:hypothetical protein
MGTEHAEALEVLREVWRSQGQTAADIEDISCERSCRRMTDAGVGFDDFAADQQGQHSQDADLGAAWRARLEREGKLSQSGGSLRDLVLGSADSR